MNTNEDLKKLNEIKLAIILYLSSIFKRVKYNIINLASKIVNYESSTCS